MARNDNSNAVRKPPMALTMVDDGTDNIADDDTYIVVGESGEDVAFEVCEDLETALGVRAIMIEDGFAVKLYQANEVEVVEEDEPKGRKA